ncbi:MAG: hypothetical protein ACUVSY_06400 [Roseiflexus sp.]
MTSTNSQSHDQPTDRSRKADRYASQRPGKRPSQPRFVLQPVVLDDTATVTNDQESDVSSTNEQFQHETPFVEERQINRLHELRDSRRTPRKDALLNRYIEMPGRHAIIGALLLCSVIAIMLFVTLLLTGRGPVI